MAKATEFKAPNQSPQYRLKWPISPLLDMFNGPYVKSQDGSYTCMGGLGGFTLIGGPGNSNKTGFALSLISRVLRLIPTSSTHAHDTELTLEWLRLMQSLFPDQNLDDEDLFTHPDIISGRIMLTDRNTMNAIEWDDYITALAEHRKTKSTKDDYLETTIVSFGAPIKTIAPHISFLDSLSDLEFDTLIDMMAKNDIDSSSNQTMDMRANGIKTRLVKKFQTIANRGTMPIITTGHMDTEIKMGQYDPSSKTLRDLGRLIFKNCPRKTAFNSSGTYVIDKVMDAEKADKKPLFPTNPKQTQVNDKSYLICNVLMARNKSGKTGYTLPAVLKQGVGVNWGLSMYHYLHKYNAAWGLSAPEGVGKDVRVELYPDVLLERANIRTLVDDPRVYRALEMTVELYIMKLTGAADVFGHMTAKKLRAGLIEKGYEIDVLLDNTQYQWGFKDGSKHTLSVPDMINMVKGTYRPVWYDALVKK